MPQTTRIMFLVISLLLLLIGILIKHYKCYWLIAGYNTSSKNEKEKIDIEGLGKLMANFSFLIAGIFALCAVLAYFKLNAASIIIMCSLFIIIPIVLVKAQKYDLSAGTHKRKTKLAIIIAIAVTALTAIFIGGMIFYGNRETKVAVNETIISITGPYSINYLIKDIESIELKDSIPEVLSKMDGYDFGVVKKGNFNLQGLGGSRLYINGSEAPYIYLKKSGKYIIINLKNREDTQDLYFKLKEAIDKSRMA